MTISWLTQHEIRIAERRKAAEEAKAESEREKAKLDVGKKEALQKIYDKYIKELNGQKITDPVGVKGSKKPKQVAFSTSFEDNEIVVLAGSAKILRIRIDETLAPRPNPNNDISGFPVYSIYVVYYVDWLNADDEELSSAYPYSYWENDSELEQSLAEYLLFLMK